MTPQTKYFRSTRQKNQLSTNRRLLWENKTNKYSRSTSNNGDTGTPTLGSKGCSLCADLSIPVNLNAHVTDSQTCADVHLQLAMLRYDNAMCATGQEQYGALCCTADSQIGFKTALAFMVGALVTGFVLKKIVSSKNRPIKKEHEENANYCNDDLPGTVNFNSRNSRDSRSSHAANRNHQVEMSSSSCYHTMEDHKTDRSHSTGRPISRSKGRPPSRSCTARGENRDNRPVSRTRDRSYPRDHKDSRPVSRTRDRSRPRDHKDNRPVSRTRDRSRPRDIMHQQRSSDRSHSRGRNQRSHSRSRLRDDRPISCSRQRDRSRPRGRSQSRERSRGVGNCRSQSRTRHRPQHYEVGKISSEDGIILSTQHHFRSRSQSLDRSRETRRSRSRTRDRPQLNDVRVGSTDGVMLSQLV